MKTKDEIFETSDRIAKVCATFAKTEDGHHTPYMILLSDAEGGLGVYVGCTGLHPIDRFAQHCRGEKAGAGIVQDHGIAILLRACAHLMNCSEPEAKRLEFELAEALKKAGFAVFGGH